MSKSWRWDGNWLVADDGRMVLHYTTADDGLHGEAANKNMVAAAPEMLAALKRLRAIINDHVSLADVDAIDAAIAKAEGRE